MELSDGYRSYLAWICDLAYHLASVSDSDTDLAEIQGVVLVDEIDLHLHPRWQQVVLSQISEYLPNLQFIVTSHSPLVAGTLPAANILMMTTDEEGFPKVVRPEEEIQGRDADQILRSPPFGLETSRTPEFGRHLSNAYQEAASGDWDAALKVMDLFAHGSSANIQ